MYTAVRVRNGRPRVEVIRPVRPVAPTLGCAGRACATCKRRGCGARRPRRRYPAQPTLGFDWGSLAVGVAQGIAGGLSRSQNQSAAVTGQIIAPITTAIQQAQAQTALLRAQLEQQQLQQQLSASQGFSLDAIPMWGKVAALGGGALVLATVLRR